MTATNGSAPSMHNTHVETREYPFDFPSVTWIAVCDCGWVGGERDSPAEAEDNGYKHEEES